MYLINTLTNLFEASNNLIIFLTPPSILKFAGATRISYLCSIITKGFI